MDLRLKAFGMATDDHAAGLEGHHHHSLYNASVAFHKLRQKIGDREKLFLLKDESIKGIKLQADAFEKACKNEVEVDHLKQRTTLFEQGAAASAPTASSSSTATSTNDAMEKKLKMLKDRAQKIELSTNQKNVDLDLNIQRVDNAAVEAAKETERVRTNSSFLSSRVSGSLIAWALTSRPRLGRSKLLL